MGETFRWDFFISHAGADAEAAKSLHRLLSTNARVFLDAECLDYGDNWDVLLAAEQKASLVTLVLVSANCDSAYYQREEIASAIQLARKDGEAHRVVPIYLDLHAEENIPFGLRVKHGIFFSRERSFDSIANRLIDLLARLRSRKRTDDRRQAAILVDQGIPVLFEMESASTYASSGQLGQHRINEALFEFAGRTAISLIGWDFDPHRITVRSSRETFRKIHSAFLSGELDQATDANWQSLGLCDAGSSYVPFQTPLVSYGEFKESIGKRTVVCHREMIFGYEGEWLQAMDFVGEKTEDPSQCAVFITRQTDSIYAHSNFIKPGCAWPTKIAADGNISLVTLLLNLLYGDLFTSDDVVRLRALHEEKVRYFVNELAFPKGTSSGFFAGATNVRFVRPEPIK